MSLIEIPRFNGEASFQQVGEFIKTKDRETGLHSERVAVFSGLIAAAAGHSQKEVALIRNVALLHDVGKIDDELLPIVQLPRKLTDEEFMQLKSHTIKGKIAAMRHGFGELSQTITEQHHENWDGTGYPFQLKGNAIHPASQIIRYADSFDAGFNKRRYNTPKDLDELYGEFEMGIGREYSPRYFSAFCAFLDQVAVPSLVS